MKIGIFGFLTILFVILKLVGFISWSWWWVLAPLWIPALCFGLFFLVAMLLGRR